MSRETGVLLRGRVTSDRMCKTVVVAVSRRVRHPICGKFVERVRRFHVHDPDDRAALGDLVEIQSCRPISKTKSWLLVRVLRTVLSTSSSTLESATSGGRG